MALVWVPFAVAAHLAARDPEQLRWLVSATFLFSFAHQPLSLWLVYGDEGQRDAHRALFTWAPLVAVTAVAAGTAAQPAAIALAGGVWNLAHTLRQRYGLSRLYGRLRGFDCSSDNQLLWAWLSAAVVIGLARTDLAVLARQVGLDQRNTTAIDALASTRAAAAVFLPLAGAIAVALTLRSVRAECRRDIHSPARLMYLGSTATEPMPPSTSSSSGGASTVLRTNARSVTALVPLRDASAVAGPWASMPLPWCP
ncbi:MAG: hypothetical protein E6G57_14735 [Actinobacteria bacterium]|nr:MAG: hypothetical protein E6G57_14735 [Actinomycetota bacterium]